MQIIGHRGARGLAPENTIASLMKALEYNVNAIEIDVRVTRDHIVVVHHDTHVHTPHGGKVRIADLTYAELLLHKADLPTLHDAIQTVSQQVPLLIEIKSGEPTAPITTITKEYLTTGWPTDRFIFVSFDFSILKEVREALPEINIIVNERWFGARATYRARKLSTNKISFNQLNIWSYFIRSVSNSKYELYCYPLNNPAKAHRWAKYGLHGVITDYPDRFSAQD